METSSKSNKTGRRFVALLTAGATLAISTLVSASTSTQVKELSPLVVPRTAHTATLLNTGQVLIAGGDDAGTAETGTAEIFDPATDSFSSALLAMAAPRIGHTATLFSDDSVLLSGGNTNSMELFTPADQKFTLNAQVMSAARTGHEAIELSGTRLLFFEGDTGNTIYTIDHPAHPPALKGAMGAAASSATLLANGKILVLGSG